MKLIIIVVTFVVAIICSVVAEYYCYYKPMKELKEDYNILFEKYTNFVDMLDLSYKEILRLNNRISKLEQGRNDVEN